jgi:hypothetical protein
MSKCCCFICTIAAFHICDFIVSFWRKMQSFSYVAFKSNKCCILHSISTQKPWLFNNQFNHFTILLTNKLLYQRVNIQYKTIIYLFLKIKIDSLPRTEEAMMESEELEKASKLTGPVSMLIYLFLNL